MGKAKRAAIVEELRIICALQARELVMSRKAAGDVTGTVCPPFGHLMSEAGRTDRQSRMVSLVTLWCLR